MFSHPNYDLLRGYIGITMESHNIENKKTLGHIHISFKFK